MSWPKKRIVSWEEFEEEILGPHVERESPLSHGFIYRGQAKDSWGLKPSLTRLLDSLGFSRGDGNAIEKSLLYRFKNRAHLFLDPRVDPSGSGSPFQIAAYLEWWSLMQHYRAPTRVLDWTSSPLVALYFATNDHWKEDGALWIAHGGLLNEAAAPSGILEKPTQNSSDFWWKDDPERVVGVMAKARPTERMLAQQGCFTVSPDLLLDHQLGITESLTKVGKSNPHYPRKVIVAAECKSELLRRLHYLNVTAASLFPGIDGLGEELEALVRLSKTDDQPGG